METQVIFTGPHRWTSETAKALDRTFHDDAGRYMAAKGVEEGDFQLWGVQINLQHVGYLVTERYPKEIFVWAYQGKDSLTVLRALGAYAAHTKIPYVGCFTTHKAFTRMFGRFKPDVSETELPGEYRFRFNAEQIANGI